MVYQPVTIQTTTMNVRKIFTGNLDLVTTTRIEMFIQFFFFTFQSSVLYDPFVGWIAAYEICVSVFHCLHSAAPNRHHL